MLRGRIWVHDLLIFYSDYDQSYTAALQSEPNHAESLLNRATTYMKLKKHNEALQVSVTPFDHIDIVL